MDSRDASSSSNNYTTVRDLVLKNEDLLYIILGKLPAKRFALSDCVCKIWHKVCNRILLRPKIASAFSLLHTTSEIAVTEVVDKVLSAPIRPHFAIANVGSGFDFNETIQWLAGRLGSQTPIIVSHAGGIMGRHAVTDQFQEVKASTGIVLTVGFVPGLKVDAIPLLKGSQVTMIDQFVKDIRDYTTSFSSCASPVGIIMFGDEDADLKLVIENLESAMSMETVIVGDERCPFIFRSGNSLKKFCEDKEHAAVALTFVSDEDKLEDTGKIQFHLAVKKGVEAIGPMHNIVDVVADASLRVTQLTAIREGNQQDFGGPQNLDHRHHEIGNDVLWPELYIGVTKRRECSIGLEKPRLITSLAFYSVFEQDDELLWVDGVDIRSGDNFQFYREDAATALASCHNVNTKFRILKAEYGSNSCLRRGIAGGVGKEVLGGFIFSCCGRGDPFFGCCNVGSDPFMENFPDVPVAGIICGGVFGRGSSNLMGQESEEESSTRSILHVFSRIYLLMSCTPVCPEH